MAIVLLLHSFLVLKKKGPQGSTKNCYCCGALEKKIFCKKIKKKSRKKNSKLFISFEIRKRAFRKVLI